MRLGRGGTDAERAGDLGIGQSVGEQPPDVGFAPGQAARAAARRGRMQGRDGERVTNGVVDVISRGPGRVLQLLS